MNPVDDQKCAIRATFTFHCYEHPADAFRAAAPLHWDDLAEAAGTSSEDASFMAPRGGIWGTSHWEARSGKWERSKVISLQLHGFSGADSLKIYFGNV